MFAGAALWEYSIQAGDTLGLSAGVEHSALCSRKTSRRPNELGTNVISFLDLREPAKWVLFPIIWFPILQMCKPELAFCQKCNWSACSWRSKIHIQYKNRKVVLADFEPGSLLVRIESDLLPQSDAELCEEDRFHGLGIRCDDGGHPVRVVLLAHSASARQIQRLSQHLGTSNLVSFEFARG